MTTSIILLTLNNLSLTIRCINSIRAYTDAPYEIIAVDNGSSDGTTGWLAAQPDIRPIANPFNRGYAAACNQGAAFAAGDTLLLLNNDTVVSKGWLSQQLAVLGSSDRIGIVGPKSNRVMPQQWISAFFSSEAEIHRFSFQFNQPKPSRWEDATCISGFCLLVRRSTWDFLGGMDEGYGIGSFEDIDLCCSALKAGLFLKTAGDTFVYHEGSCSFQANRLDMHALAAANRRYFIRKWGFNPERLMYGDPVFWPGRVERPHPFHAPSMSECPDGWYAMDPQGRVYRIEKRRRRPVANPDTLSRLRVTADRIARVSPDLLERFPFGEPLNADHFPLGFPHVYLVQDPAGGMHIVNHGIRHAIGNENAFRALGFRWEEAVRLSYSQLYALHEGWPVGTGTCGVWEETELIDYRLYRGPDGGLYYGEGQRLRAVPDVAALQRYGLRARDAVSLPAEMFFRMPKGSGLP